MKKQPKLGKGRSMNKVLKGLVAVAATAAMAIAGFAGASTAMAEENTTATTNPTITFPTDTKYLVCLAHRSA